MTSGATPISSMEDILRALDEHPEWVEAFRTRILGERTVALLDNVAEILQSINDRLASVEEGQRELAETVRDLVAAVQALTVRMDDYERRSARDFGVLKGYMMKTVAKEEAADIADILGLRYVATLSVAELRDLTDNSGDTSDIAPGDLVSFRRADLIAKALDANGDTCYFAAEASFVVSRRDTDRAVRNAGVLTRFTGKPAYPAVAGVSLHEAVQQVVFSGEVPWHTITEDELTGG